MKTKKIQKKIMKQKECLLKPNVTTGQCCQNIQEQIRYKAYELYTQRGVIGDDWTDWFEAEKMILSQKRME